MDGMVISFPGCRAEGSGSPMRQLRAAAHPLDDYGKSPQCCVCRKQCDRTIWRSP